MPCPQCAHCQALAAAVVDVETFTLPAPPTADAPDGNRAFYARYGVLYDLAATRTGQPGRLLRQINPWLTASQCKSYLSRARAIGSATAHRRAADAAPVAGDVPAAPGRTGATAPDIARHPDLVAALEHGAVFTVSLVRNTTRLSRADAQALHDSHAALFA